MKNAPILRGQFAVGQGVLLDGRFGVIKLYDEQVEAILFYDDNRLQQYASGTLRQKLIDQRLRFTGELENLPSSNRLTKKQRKTISRRERYCLEMLNLKTPHVDYLRESTIAKVASELHDKNPPGGSTVSRWLKRYIADGYDMRKQVVLKPSRPLRVDEEINELMIKSLRRFYIAKRKSILYSYNKFIEEYNRLGYQGPPPSEATFRRRSEDLPRLEVIDGREGRHASREAGRTTTTGFRLNRILERVELDSAHFNIGVLDEDGNYVGALSMNIAICAFSRVILGYSIEIGKKGETSGGVADMILNSVNVKSDPDYPYHGIPELFVTDNGPAYLSGDVRNLVEAMGSNLDHAPTFMGWAKPFVEAFIGTMRKSFWTDIDGYLGKYNPKKYQKDRLIKTANITVSQICKKVAEYIRDVYHHTPHSGLNGLTPHQVWMQNVVKFPPIIPQDFGELRLFRGVRYEHRTLNSVKGVFHGGQWYQTPELSQLYHELHGNRKDHNIYVDILVNPLDASAVTVIDPRSGGRLDVTHAQKLPEGISFAELKAGRRRISIGEEFGANVKHGVLGTPSNTRRRRGPDIPVENDKFDPEMMWGAPERPLFTEDDAQDPQDPVADGLFYRDDENDDDDDDDEDENGYEFESA